MPNFDKYSNYNENAGVSGVVFGSGANVLEVEMNEMQKVFEEQGIETEIFNIGNKDIRGCIACGRCGQLGKCVFDDAVNEFDDIKAGDY